MIGLQIFIVLMIIIPIAERIYEEHRTQKAYEEYLKQQEKKKKDEKDRLQRAWDAQQAEETTIG